MKILIATTNPAKFAELQLFLSDLPYEFVSLSDVGIVESVEETGSTFEENAFLKASYYASRAQMPAIADDGGFEIDALGGAPGVKSHRWIHGDREDTDEELIAYTIEKMKNIPLEKRGAQLRLVLAIVLPDGRRAISEAAVRGVVAETPFESRTHGFPYRALLYLPQFGKFYDNTVMTNEEIDAVNHRKKAVKLLAPKIDNLLTTQEKRLE
jgi:XTP/dITP diphosphohydrolase